MNILISGASGLIGSYLVPYFEVRGHNVLKLTRNENQQGSIIWNPAQGILDLPSSMAIDAVIHLAGENIAAGRWTKKKKERIRCSRKEGTRLLSQRIAELEVKPEVMLSASGIGFYGSQGDRILTEADPPGKGFLADVSRDWEEATFPAEEAGIRVIHMRIGPVLTTKGGALKRMLPSFRFGFGATMGSGRQYMSWILMEDTARAMEFLLSCYDLSGPVNFCSPHPVTNREFSRTLGKALNRPAFFRIPGLVLRLLFGELSSELLSSTRGRPERLLKTGFKFHYPELDASLRYILGKRVI